MLGYDIRWSEVPMIIKIGIVLWIGAIICFVVMVASAILPMINVPVSTLLNVAYLGAILFMVGVIMVIIGLPRTQNHHPTATKSRGKKSK